jgi:predicted deacylase
MEANMARAIRIGTARSKKGVITYGKWEMLDHPTGHTEFLPVIIAQGKKDGPCLWLTAGIHGPEQCGPAVVYRLLTKQLTRKMKGTIVAIPALNPAGLRTSSRAPYHAPRDPNRLWPDGKPRKKPDPDKTPPSSLEKAYAELFKDIKATADYLIDYHNAWTNSIPFAFRDRVLYRTDRNKANSRKRAQKLAAKLDEMLRAFGHTVVNEFSAKKYIDETLHRSTSGAALLVAHVPAFTVELGTGHMPDPAIVDAAATGTRNVMRWAGMLHGEPEPIEGVPVVDPGYAVRRRSTPRVKEPCIVLHRVEPGDILKKGDVVADVLDVWGRPLGEGVVRSEHDGFVMGRSHGIYFYPGDSILGMAIRDKEPLIAPYPKEFYKKPGRKK